MRQARQTLKIESICSNLVNSPHCFFFGGQLARSNRGYNGILLIASERSEHTVVLSLTFLSIYIYSVTKISVRPILRRISGNYV